MLPLASFQDSALARWVDAQTLRRCAACGQIFQLWFDPRDEYYELATLPTALLPLLQGSRDVQAAIALLHEGRFLLTWVERWLSCADYDLQSAVDALTEAAGERNATPERIERLVRGWAVVRQRAGREKTQLHPHDAQLKAAAKRRDVFRQPGDAHVQIRIENILRQFTPDNLGQLADPLDVLSKLDAPPDADQAVEIQRALIELRQQPAPYGQGMPTERATRLLAAFRAMKGWPENLAGDSFAAMVRRDTRELLDGLYRTQRLPALLQREAATLLDAELSTRLSPPAFCEERPAQPGRSACKHCATVNDGDLQFPPGGKILVPVRQSGWTDAVPPFVGGEWICALKEDRLAVCPVCDTYFWLHAMPKRHAPEIVRLSPAIRPLLVSTCHVEAVVALLCSPAYHAERLRGFRELACRFINGAYGFYPPQPMLDALLARLGEASKQEAVLCGDVMQDLLELIARVIDETTHRIDDWHWPADRALSIEVTAPLLELLRNHALAHVSPENGQSARRWMRARLKHAVFTPNGSIVSGLRHVAQTLVDLLQNEPG